MAHLIHHNHIAIINTIHKHTREHASVPFASSGEIPNQYCSHNVTKTYADVNDITSFWNVWIYADVIRIFRATTHRTEKCWRDFGPVDRRRIWNWVWWKKQIALLENSSIRPDGPWCPTVCDLAAVSCTAHFGPCCFAPLLRLKAHLQSNNTSSKIQKVRFGVSNRSIKAYLKANTHLIWHRWIVRSLRRSQQGSALRQCLTNAFDLKCIFFHI